MSQIINIPLDQLVPSKLQVRVLRNKEADKELQARIAAKGILIPLIVRPSGDYYEILDGHRRVESARANKLKEAPCEVREMNDDDASEFILITGLQGEQIHPLDEAEAYKKLRKRLTIGDIAKKVGTNIKYVARRLALTGLIPKLAEQVKSGRFPVWSAEIVSREQPEIQEALIKDGLIKYHLGDEDWIKRSISHFHNDLGKIPWKQDDALLDVKAGACTSCAKRTDNASELFPELAKNICLDGHCFNHKLDLVIANAMEKLKKEGHKPHYLTERNTHSYSFDNLPSQYTGNLLYSDQFRFADKHYEAITEGHGVYIDGPQRGRTARIATKWKDKRGFDNTSGSDEDNKYAMRARAERKATITRTKIHNEVSNRIATELLAKLPTSYTRAHWDIVIRRLVEDMSYDVQRRLGDAMKVIPIKSGNGKDYKNPVLKQLLNGKLFRPERVVLALTASSDLLYGYSGTLRHLTPLAKLAGIKIDRILREVKSKIAEKKSRKNSVKKSTAKAKRKAA